MSYSELEPTPVNRQSRLWLAIVIGSLFIGFFGSLHADDTGIDFNRDVRPILSDKCFACHGPDRAAAKTDLRLDVRAEAVAHKAIRPSQPDESLLIQRIKSANRDERMPPAESNRTLTADQIRTLERWIANGAEYAPHWAFVAPKSPPLPIVKDANWVRNPIDQFILAELERRNLRPSPPADPATLTRRVALTVTGLTMTTAESAAFQTNPTDESYEALIKQLFRSPRYAERMTLDWLDAGRYADTNGYYRDFPRQTWPWRDWVLRAFARNMPFDQFTIEQLAGDLLPDATTDQKVATAFLRNHMVTDESGSIDEEFRVSYVADRTETMSTVWLGVTVGCAKCHDHKYDPISQREYYELFAFFNNIPETGLVHATNNPPPILSLPTAEQEQQLATLRADRTEKERQLAANEPDLQQAEQSWLMRAAFPAVATGNLAVHLDFDDRVIDSSPRQIPVKSVNDISFAQGLFGRAATFDASQYVEFAGPSLETDQAFSLSVWIKPGSAPIGYVITKMDDTAAQRGFEVLWYKAQPRLNLVRTWRREAIELTATDTFSGGEWHHLVVSYDGSGKAAGFTVCVDGSPHRMSVRRDTLNGPVTNDAPWQVAWKGSGLGYDGQLDELRIYQRALSPAEAENLYWSDVLSGAARLPIAERSKQLGQLVRRFYLTHASSDQSRIAAEDLERTKRSESDLLRQITSVAVMQELPKPRDTFVLVRGQYDQRADKVSAGTPFSLRDRTQTENANRLVLARWLVAPENPLTARVVVNRLWQQVFGEGLVRTVNDFGLQGEAPTHPELLDWLAVEFVRYGWDTQHMLRLMVTSATYRQSSAFTPELLQRDPDDRLHARGPRFRLSGEVIRDQALAIGGLLVERVGGPSVKPYQPAGLWEAVSYNGDQSYEQDHGESLYRRSLYTFWKRQAPPPEMLTFDGPTRETCVVRRPRTNTPLQSLVLLNDVTYVEAARGLAERMMRDGGTSDSERAKYGFLLATGRKPSTQELNSVLRLFERQLQSYLVDQEAAKKLIAVGEHPANSEFRVETLAAWTTIGSLLLNLDEVLTLH